MVWWCVVLGLGRGLEPSTPSVGTSASPSKSPTTSLITGTSGSRRQKAAQILIHSKYALYKNFKCANKVGNITLDNNQVLRATYIPTSAELIQGDTVITSGLGGIYRRGIFIGTVKEIVTTSNVTDRYAVIEPAVDFSKLETVLVIND